MNKLLFLILLLCVICTNSVEAQQNVEFSDNQKELQDVLDSGALADEFSSAFLSEFADDLKQRIVMRQPNINDAAIPSLFFTNREINLIEESESGFVARAVTEEEVRQADDAQENEIRPELGPRELRLGGILYSSANNWTVWLNGQKITPKRLPPEVLDITVGKEYIKFKWFDAYTNQIFPIKLKAHQRFNLDSRLFLPG